jgi:hypothetical protein
MRAVPPNLKRIEGCSSKFKLISDCQYTRVWQNFASGRNTGCEKVPTSNGSCRYAVLDVKSWGKWHEEGNLGCVAEALAWNRRGTWREQGLSSSAQGGSCSLPKLPTFIEIHRPSESRLRAVTDRSNHGRSRESYPEGIELFLEK